MLTFLSFFFNFKTNKEKRSGQVNGATLKQSSSILGLHLRVTEGKAKNWIPE